MQHLELARETVAHVHLDPPLDRRVADFGFRLQSEDRVLHAREPGGRGVLDETRRIARCGAFGQFVQHVQLRLRLPAPFGEQRMTDLLVVAPPGSIERLGMRGGHDVEPEFAARVQRVDAHVDPARQFAQQRDVQRRHRRQREHADRFGPVGPRDRVGIEMARFDEEAVCRRRAAVAQLGEQRTPQRGLPALVVARGVADPARRGVAREHRFAGLPRGQPFGAIGQVVIEHGRDAMGQFVAHRIVGGRQIRGEPRRREPRRTIGRLREQPVAAPHEPVGCERRARGHRQHAADLRPQPLREIGELDVRAHAIARGDVELETAAQRRARHDDLLRRPRAVAGRERGQILEQRVGQRFVTVRIEEMEHEAGVGTSHRRGRANRMTKDSKGPQPRPSSGQPAFASREIR
ncbi:hypothetical protein P355_1949 [Burkholderia cenocepacia KC-01]|nr:hypothetical protein P355_1949 [Burkholderia cenocepacia KC-01]